MHLVLLADAAGSANSAVQIVVDGQGSTAVKLLLTITALSFAPALLLSVTSFTRIVIVLGFVRQSMGLTNAPPNQVMVGLALFLTIFIMGPIFSNVYDNALVPYLEDEIGHVDAFEQASIPLRKFMLQHTRVEDLRLFYEVSGRDRPQKGEEIPMSVVVPAFMVSELTTAFRIALFIFIPFVMIDLVVASLAMSLGMVMVPPIMLSLPLKLGVFLAADGWRLVISSLVGSF